MPNGEREIIIDKYCLKTNFAFFVGQDVCLAGDGRYDSPGHSARYCSYTLMDAVSIKMYCQKPLFMNTFSENWPGDHSNPGESIVLILRRR